MTKRNIIIGKAGGNSPSGKNYKVSLPSGMVKALGITEDDREVVLELVKEYHLHYIVISKKGAV